MERDEEHWLLSLLDYYVAEYLNIDNLIRSKQAFGYCCLCKRDDIMMNLWLSRCLFDRDILFLGSLYLFSCVKTALHLLSDQNSQVM